MKQFEFGAKLTGQLTSATHIDVLLSPITSRRKGTYDCILI
jgi:hypothetical protein